MDHPGHSHEHQQNHTAGIECPVCGEHSSYYGEVCRKCWKMGLMDDDKI